MTKDNGTKRIEKGKRNYRNTAGKELGVSERSIIRWEKEGLRNASFKHVVKISQLFEVDLNELGNRSEING